MAMRGTEAVSGNANGLADTRVGVLATFALPAGRPGAAARAVFSAGAAGVLRVHSLRDGTGCGALLAHVRTAGGVSCLQPLCRAEVLAGLTTGAIAYIVACGGSNGSVRGAAGGDTLAWTVAYEVQAHRGPVTRLLVLNTPDVPARPGTAAAGPTAGVTTEQLGMLAASTGADGTLQVWRDRGGSSGGWHRIASHAPSASFGGEGGDRGGGGGDAGPGVELCALVPRDGGLLLATTCGRVAAWSAVVAPVSADATVNPKDTPVVPVVGHGAAAANISSAAFSPSGGVRCCSMTRAASFAASRPTPALVHRGAPPANSARSAAAAEAKMPHGTSAAAGCGLATTACGGAAAPHRLDAAGAMAAPPSACSMTRAASFAVSRSTPAHVHRGPPPANSARRVPPQAPKS